jgi:chitinase
VDSLGAWWPATTIAAGTGVPGYAQTTKYNVFNVAFWTHHSPLGATTLWDSPLSFMGTDTPFGTTDDAVRKTWIDAFHDAGAKVLVSAFGATDNPCSEGENAQQTCTQLSVWAKENGFDGVDIDFEDTGSFNYNGDGEAWLIECTRSVRNVLPLGEYIVTHAPQAPYFDGLYPHGAYIGVNKEVGGAPYRLVQHPVLQPGEWRVQHIHHPLQTVGRVGAADLCRRTGKKGRSAVEGRSGETNATEGD